MEIREAARSVAKGLGYPYLKPERLEVVETFVKGRDVFAVLPTIHYSVQQEQNLILHSQK